MGRMCSAVFDNITVTNDSDQDIIELVNSANCVAILHAIEMTSGVTTDEVVRLRLMRRSTTGTGGTGITETHMDGDTSTIQVAASYLVTTPGTASDILEAWQWHQLIPFQFIPTPECRPIIAPSGRIALNLQSAVASSRVWSGHAIWEELS